MTQIWRYINHHFPGTILLGTFTERQIRQMQIIKPTDLPQEEDNIHPSGTFKAVVINATAELSRSGNQMIVVTFKTDHGKLKHYLNYLSDKRWALERFYKQLAALGVTFEFIEAADDWDEVALNCIKGEALISVEHKPGREEGRTLVNVSSVDSVG